MKRQKPNHRIPWEWFDDKRNYTLKGWWKTWVRRKERRYGKIKAKDGNNDR